MIHYLTGKGVRSLYMDGNNNWYIYKFKNFILNNKFLFIRFIKY